MFKGSQLLAPVFQPDVYSYISKDRSSSTNGYLFRASDLLLQLTTFLSNFIGAFPEALNSLFMISSFRSAVDLISQTRMSLAVKKGNDILNQLANKKPYSGISQGSFLSLFGSQNLLSASLLTLQESQQTNRNSPSLPSYSLEELKILKAKVHKSVMRGIVTHCKTSE
uniref:VPS13_C domain-containing protein n=1 Tax=Strongyloides venezuelensis TaxID=75913 RepID=A0A0K0FPD7_STRVS